MVVGGKHIQGGGNQKLSNRIWKVTVCKKLMQGMRALLRGESREGGGGGGGLARNLVNSYWESRRGQPRTLGACILWGGVKRRGA